MQPTVRAPGSVCCSAVMSVTPIANSGGASSSPNKGAAASGTFALGGSVAGAATRLCCNCEDQCAVSTMCPWSNTSWTCHVCKTNYNRQIERNSQDPSLRKWWKALAKPDKVSWFKRNKSTYEPNKRHAFDKAGLYEEESAKSSHKDDDRVWNYIPMDDWIIRQKLLGKLGTGTDEDQYSNGVKLFESAIMNKDTAKKFVNNSWLIGVWAGVQERVGERAERRVSNKRQKTMDDSVSFAAAQELQGQAEADRQAWQAAHSEASGSHVPDASDQVQIHAGLVRFPAARPAPEDDLAEGIRRETLLEMQRQTKIAEQEEIDDHEAKESDKLRKAEVAAVGRPKKLRCEVLSDVQKFVRDRLNHITDTMEKLKTEWAGRTTFYSSRVTEHENELVSLNESNARHGKR